MLKTLRISWVKFLLHVIDHKYFNTRFVQNYKKIFSNIPSERIVIFDVGSHEGEYIVLFRKLFPNCQIHCFEPDVENFKKISQKYAKIPGIYLNNFGIGDTNLQQKFYRNILSYTSSYKEIDLNAEWTKTKSKILGVQPNQLIVSETEVQMKTLDSYIEQHSIGKVDILKIDAEGYEIKCLQGAQKLLKNGGVNSIQLEIHVDDMYQDHYSITDIEHLLLPHGYILYKKEAHFLLKCDELIFTRP